MKDSFNRACELPQTVKIEACDCDISQTCLHSSTPGISTGDGSSVTGDIYGPVPGDRIEGSNVGLGPAGIGMMALGLLLLLCKSWVKSLFAVVLPNKKGTRLAFIWPFLFSIYGNFCENLELNKGTGEGKYVFNNGN